MLNLISTRGSPYAPFTAFPCLLWFRLDVAFCLLMMFSPITLVTRYIYYKIEIPNIWITNTQKICIFKVGYFIRWVPIVILLMLFWGEKQSLKVNYFSCNSTLITKVLVTVRISSQNEIPWWPIALVKCGLEALKTQGTLGNLYPWEFFLCVIIFTRNRPNSETS